MILDELEKWWLEAPNLVLADTVTYFRDILALSLRAQMVVQIHDATTCKQKKSKSIKVFGRGGAIGSGDTRGPAHETCTPSSSRKFQHVKGVTIPELEVIPISKSSGIPDAALPLIGRFAHPPPPPGLVFSADPDLLLKDASRFVMEFDGYA